MTNAFRGRVRVRLAKNQGRVAKQLVARVLKDLPCIVGAPYEIACKVHDAIARHEELAPSLAELPTSEEARLAALEWAIQQLIGRGVLRQSSNVIGKTHRGVKIVLMTLTHVPRPAARPHRDKYHSLAPVRAVA